MSSQTEPIMSPTPYLQTPKPHVASLKLYLVTIVLHWFISEVAALGIKICLLVKFWGRFNKKLFPTTTTLGSMVVM